MVFLLYFLSLFLCMICTPKLVQFILHKISPIFNNHEVQPPNHSAPESSSESDAASSSDPCEHDVFLSFRGEDTRKTFVDHLYLALEDRQINTYKDDITLPLGQSIGPSLKKAIKESRIAVVIFSKNYANSSWCLDELAYIMKCRDKRRGLVVIPVFYDVDPSDVRKQKGDFGKSFAKQEAAHSIKAELWRKALFDTSNISGWEAKNIANGHEALVIKKIVDSILSRLLPLDSDVDEDFVGMRHRLQALESLLEMGSYGVRMVGIWGIGGSGKTTLATSFYMKMCQHFQGHCILENVREESKHGLKKLQENILSTIFKKMVEVQSLEEGKRQMKTLLRRRKVLVILDDVDDLSQLEALVGNHNWFGSGSRIIITTRDEHLLTAHAVDNVLSSTLLSHDEAIQLFNIHAFKNKKITEDYETLPQRVISYACGLPLALKVLGSFLCGKDKNEWISALKKLRDISDPKIINTLRISYDGLETYQKELFLDIACFWRFGYLHKAEKIFEAFGYHPRIGLKVLREKALITIGMDGRFDMHDLIQEMGHTIVRGEHPNNHEKQNRVWKGEDIKNMRFEDATMENDKIVAIKVDSLYNVYDDDDLSHLCNVVSKMKKLRWLRFETIRYDDEGSTNCHDGPIFLSNELWYIHWKGYPGRSPFSDTLNLVNLVVLKLTRSYQDVLWKDPKHLPQLKEFILKQMWKLVKTPPFVGPLSLQNLVLHECLELKEINLSLVNHSGIECVRISDCAKLRMFPTFVKMKNLKTLSLQRCRLSDGEIPSGMGELRNLQELDLTCNLFSRLDFSLSQLSQLKLLDLSWCTNLIELPELPSCLAVLKADRCRSLINIGECYKSISWLCQVSFYKVPGNVGPRLLESMLKGHAIANGPMYLLVSGVEIPKEFTPPLLRGNDCRLDLPENWCDDFSGFLFCLAMPTPFSFRVSISADDVTSGTDSLHNEVWESDQNDKNTMVGYVPFGSLRHTLWWDQTYNSLVFRVTEHMYYPQKCSGFSVGLVEKTSRSGMNETPRPYSSSSYAPGVKIERDSVSAVTVSLYPYTY